MSTEFVIAHSPAPSARAHGNISSQMKFATLRAATCYFAQRRVTSRSDVLHPPLTRSPFPSQHCDLRFKLHCDLRSSAEGSVAHQNFYVNITRARRNRILTIRIRISRQCPPQARPMVAPAFFFPLRTNSRAMHDEARQSTTKGDP